MLNPCEYVSKKSANIKHKINTQYMHVVLDTLPILY